MSELKTNLQSILQEKNTKIIPQNIKKNVEVLGVTGSYDKEDIKELEAKLADAQNELATVRRDLDNSTATISGSGEIVTLNGTAEARFKKPPLPMGNSEQDSTTGANIFNLKKFLTDRNVPYTENTDGSLTFAVSGDYQSLNSQPLQFSDTDIAVSLQGLITLGTAVNVRIEILDSNNNWTGQITSSASKTENRTASKIRFNWGDVGTVTIKNVMLNIGSTAQPYEPYTGGEASPNPQFESPITNVTGDVEVKVQNKNRLPITGTGTYTLNGITFKTNADGSVKVSGTATANVGVALSNDGIFNADVYSNDAKVFMINGNQTYSSGSTSGKIRTIFIENIAPAYEFIASTYNSRTFTYTGEVRLRLSIANGETVDETIYPILEQGSTASPYTPHKEQTFTFPLGNEKLMLGDYLADDGIHHVRKQVVLDESIFMQYNNEAGEFYTVNQNYLPNYKNNTPIYTNYFLYNNLGTWEKNCIGITNTNTLWLYIENGPTSLTDLRTWLSTHNVIVEYELTEEIIVPYTTSQQTAYNQIKQALSYEEQTNISGSSSGSNPIFIVIALRNMNDTLNTLENEIELLP